MDSFFCFVVSHLHDSAKKKKTEVEISVHNVFRCILTTNKIITPFLLNYKPATLYMYVFEYQSSKCTWFSRKKHPIIYLKHNKVQGGMVKLYVQSLRGSYGPSAAGSGLNTAPSSTNMLSFQFCTKNTTKLRLS